MACPRRPLSVRFVALAGMSVVLSALAATSTAAQERYSAFLIDFRDSGSMNSTGAVQISVARYSQDTERVPFFEVLKTKGYNALYDLFRTSSSVGHLSIPGKLEIDMEYSEATSLKDGGRRILLVGYRQVTLTEKSDHPDSARFPFSVVELRLKPKGEGDGFVALRAQVSIGKNGELTYEDFAAPATQLRRVRLE
jgi:hypothetical protein